MTLVLTVLTMPVKMIQMLRRENFIETEMQVVVEGPEGTGKDDLLFVHGWPDCGEMWDK